jgi:Tol biopolymer transport system component
MERFGVSLVGVLLTVLLLASPASATTTGKNGPIAFRRVLGDGWAAIFTVKPDGTRLRQVTHPKQGKWTTEPSWSPNGRWIVYDVWRDASEDNARIVKIRPDGTHRTYLDASCTTGCISDDFPAWSPDGTRIVFHRGLGTRPLDYTLGALFTMSTDGTHVRQVTQRHADPTVTHRFSDEDPAWSPNGRRLVFQRVARDNLHAIFTVRLDGTHLRRLTPWKLDAASPDWSPRGGWIAFRTRESSETKGDLGLVRPDGESLHLITSGKGKWGLLAFSPDGLSIVSSLNDDLYTMEIDGTHIRSIVHTSANEAIPAWGPRRR